MRLIDADKMRERIEVKHASAEILTEAAILREWVDSQETVGGWISVKDRLPEKNGTYLVFCDGESVFSAFYERGRGHSEWTDDYEEYCDLDVTHWMPLPEPPKGDENVNEEPNDNVTTPTWQIRVDELEKCQQMICRETLLRHPANQSELYGWEHCAKMIYNIIQTRITELNPTTYEPFT